MKLFELKSSFTFKSTYLKLRLCFSVRVRREHLETMKGDELKFLRCWYETMLKILWTEKETNEEVLQMFDEVLYNMRKIIRRRNINSLYFSKYDCNNM